LLLAPAGGDELQGVKRGIMEMADMILVNKADGDLRATAMRTCADYAGALRLLRKRPQDPQGFPCAMTVSATENVGIDAAWDKICELTTWRRDHGHYDRRRSDQSRFWFGEDVRQGLLAALAHPKIQAQMESLAQAVAQGDLRPERAAQDLLDMIHIEIPR